MISLFNADLQAHTFFLFADSVLMKEPVLPDRLTEHAEFCRYATMLIRLVVGTLSDGVLSGDMSLERVRRAEIVAKTRIQWDHEELLELIYRHLLTKGTGRFAITYFQSNHS